MLFPKIFVVVFLSGMLFLCGVYLTVYLRIQTQWNNMMGAVCICVFSNALSMFFSVTVSSSTRPIKTNQQEHQTKKWRAHFLKSHSWANPSVAFVGKLGITIDIPHDRDQSVFKSYSPFCHLTKLFGTNSHQSQHGDLISIAPTCKFNLLRRHNDRTREGVDKTTMSVQFVNATSIVVSSVYILKQRNTTCYSS